jgi:AraC-like DNA-binding protein
VYRAVVRNSTPRNGTVQRTAAVSAGPLYLLAYAAERGFSREAAIQHFGLDPSALEDADGRVPIETVARMWNELPVLLGDPDLPLHAIHYAARIDPPLVVLIFLSSATLGDALRRLARYQRVTLDLADEPSSELVVDGERTHVVLYHERSTLLPPTGAVVDAMLGILTLARLATGQPITPVEVTLRHMTPRRPVEYEAAFGCAIRFEASRDRLTLKTADLGLRHPDASRTLLAITERHASGQLAELNTADDFLGSVRHAVRARLPDGQVGLAALAKALRLSARTLQRRLEVAGTSLRRLVDEERRALALHHIQNPRTSLVDIALLVGFADQSAFTRAFTRWVSRSPSEYRRFLKNGDS